jgi:hypothetical protein
MVRAPKENRGRTPVWRSVVGHDNRGFASCRTALSRPAVRLLVMGRSHEQDVPGYVSDEPPECQRIDPVVTTVIATIFIWYVVRALIPALLDGSEVVLPALVGVLLVLCLALSLQPLWIRRRSDRRFHWL